jgi:hypothetical protein
VFSVAPTDLGASLKPYPQEDLTGSLYSWGEYDLSAYVKQIYSSNLNASLFGHYPFYYDLGARLTGVAHGQKNLVAYARGVYKGDLTADINPIYIKDLPAFVRSVPSVNLSGNIYSWDLRDLTADITSTVYPWDLPASIYGRDSIYGLSATIYPTIASNVDKYLRASVYSWNHYSLSASLTGDNSPILTASIVPTGYSKDLHASLTPKRIHLTGIIPVMTMEHKDLSAIINVPCFYTGYSNLSGYLHTTYKSELVGIIRGMSLNTLSNDLPAKIGTTDSYSVVDKYRLSIIMSPADFMTEDKFRLTLSVLRNGLTLSASITGISHIQDLIASITGDEIPSFNYDRQPKNREKVIDRTYSGHLKSYEIVEFMFKSIVEDYYYSSDGDTAWKSNRLNRWALDVKSYLPKNILLNLKRRLHKSAVLL